MIPLMNQNGKINLKKELYTHFKFTHFSFPKLLSWMTEHCIYHRWLSQPGQCCHSPVIRSTVFEIRGFRLSEPTKYSDGQPELAKELSVGQPALFSGTIKHTKMADHLLERV